MKTWLHPFRKFLGLSQQQNENSSIEAVSKENLEKIWQGLSKSYKDRLRSKLATRYPINLELIYSTEGTTTKAPIYDNMTVQSPEIRGKLLSLFYKHKGRLLVIGEPGAGKTTLLLQLAIQLLKRNEY